ncbi:hypothetical protein FOZ61_006971 [Perkinsus olseni]|uniref:Uncharacterized protein n=1 Tax=Perkinsus olseni TaxID=32597 RepID=A0A7J6M9H2_PEROL|nr:hypothetical protein FOZ61_006971 [Perkinsus olseni]
MSTLLPVIGLLSCFLHVWSYDLAGMYTGKFPDHNPKFETNVTFHKNTLDFDARFLGHFGAAKSVPYSRGAGNAIAVDVDNADLHKAFKDMQAFMSPSAVLEDLHYDRNKNEVWKDVPFFGRLAMHYVRA